MLARPRGNHIHRQIPYVIEPHSEGHFAIHLRRDDVASAKLQWPLRLDVTQQDHSCRRMFMHCLNDVPKVVVYVTAKKDLAQACLQVHESFLAMVKR